MFSQKGHVEYSLDDVFSRYTPQVKPHRYKLSFVPVVESEEEGLNLPKNGLVLTISLPITTKVLYANSLDPDEMPNNSASHPGTSCLKVLI